MSGVTIERDLLGDVAQAIAERTGLSFPDERLPDLERGVRAAATTLAVQDPAAWARRIVAGDLVPRERQVLIDRLTVGETYFRREPAAFEALEQVVLPALLAARAATSRSLQLWSAGCCTGEEAYSLAVTCLRSIEDLPTWRVSVLGTDVNEHALEKARRGVYGTWSFRGTPEWLRPRYFTQAPGQAWEIGTSVRRLVRFAAHNLAADAFPRSDGPDGRWDVIFCRNVIMYLTSEHQREVFARLHASLADDGILVLSPAEGGWFARTWFDQEHIGQAIIYRKGTLGVRAQPGAASRPRVAAAPAAGASPARPAPARRPRRPSPTATAQPPTPAATPPLDHVAPDPATTLDPLARAREQADQGCLDAAIPLCLEALERDPSCLPAGFLLAAVFADLGRLDDEADALRRVLDIDPGFILAHRALGDLERRRGRPAEARRHFHRALELLAVMDRSDVVPESGGITAGRLAEAIRKVSGA